MKKFLFGLLAVMFLASVAGAETNGTTMATVSASNEGFVEAGLYDLVPEGINLYGTLSFDEDYTGVGFGLNTKLSTRHNLWVFGGGTLYSSDSNEEVEFTFGVAKKVPVIFKNWCYVAKYDNMAGISFGIGGDL